MASQKLRNVVLSIIIVLITAQVIAAFSIGVQPVSASRIIYIPNNYSTITAGIGNATAGDTIVVNNGVYQENIVIDKQVFLNSATLGGAIIVGTGGIASGINPAVTVTADGVVFSGFTIQSLPYSNNKLFATGIKLSADNCNISNNTINATYYGVFSSYTSGSFFSGNVISYTAKDGLRICGGGHNTFTNNIIKYDGGSGLALAGYLDTVTGNTFVGNVLRGLGLGASYCVVWGNNFTANNGTPGQGIYLGGSNNIISSNIIAKNPVGMYLTANGAAPNNNTIYSNNFINNTIKVQEDEASQYNNQTWSNRNSGNYWSSYNGIDADNDGIGDTPYELYLNNADPYPLMNPAAMNGQTPALPNAPTSLNGLISIWNFDEVWANGATPDSVGDNPVIVETLSGHLISPALVPGYQGNALKFNGSDYAYVGDSSTLHITGEFTIDAWVNIQQYKNVSYNAIIEESLRTLNTYPTRTYGLAFNGVPPENGGSFNLGAVRGFLLGGDGVFNEIDTTSATLPLNEWTHVVLVRSLSTGMHIYINGIEAAVTLTSGSQNPSSTIADGSEYYIGHDSMSTIDNLAVSSIAVPQSPPTIQPTLSPTAATTSSPTLMITPLWQEWWFYAAVAFAAITFLASTFWLARKRKKFA